MLERIRAEKARLIKEGKIKKDKYESIIFKKDNSYYEKVNDIERCIDDEIPFDIPDSWEWCRLNSILLNNIGGGTPSKSKPGYWNGSIPWASVKDLPNGDILLRSTIDSITQQGLKNSSSNLIPKGNVIICTRMGLGKIVITEIDVAINQDLRGLFLPDYIDKLFFVFFYKTVTIKGQGLTVKGITLNMINKILVPLPPLAEQHRIVAKVEEIKQSIKKI